MEVLAKSHQFNSKRARNTNIYFIVLISGFFLAGLIMLIIGLNNGQVIMSVAFFAPGVALLLVYFVNRLLYRKTYYAKPRNYIFFDSNTGNLLLTPKYCTPVTKNIKNLTNIKVRFYRGTHVRYSYGKLELEFGYEIFTFDYVGNISDVSNKLVYYQEKYKLI
jgi:hypothetical protein